MSTLVFTHNLCSISSHSPNCCQIRASGFLSSNSILKLNKRTLLSHTRIRISRTQKPRFSFKVLAVQSNFFRVLQTVWKVGRDGIEAGTDLVPNIVPRPIARISVTILALSVSLFVLKSVLSTAFFVLATMGLAYFAFIAFNKDEGPKGGGDTTSKPIDDPVEEARKIMEKYK